MSQWDSLRPYSIYLSEGYLLAEGAYPTALADSKANVQTHLPEYVATTKKPRVVIYAHGEQVKEKAGLRLAQRRAPRWLAKRIADEAIAGRRTFHVAAVTPSAPPRWILPLASCQRRDLRAGTSNPDSSRGSTSPGIRIPGGIGACYER